MLATAFTAKAEVIVTGDDDQLTKERHANVPILSPRQFLERLAGLK